ncbi:replication endonuclease, partial [Citrobacter freundii]
GEWIDQKKRNLEFFKKFDLLNDEGLRIALDSMVHRSVANPAIRRCELMVRMRGFEDMANEEGLAGEFYTITAPSRFHAVHSKGGFVSQWDGCTPQDTQRYLCGVWAKARAAISRAGIHVFGFRVVEPHHDGTPHWHMLLFMRPCDVDTVRDILCYHARITDSEELQTPYALKARFHVEAIDPAKGSATGYIAKYISKNIDGFALDGEQDDETGESLRDMAKSVSAWASRWRIRQFQQIGGAPVTVWRELRRLRDQVLTDRRMDAVLAAADVGDWAAYTQAQGGALVARRDLVVRLAYEITEQGNEYAEDVQRVQGVYSPLVPDSAVCTRLVKWQKVAKLAEAPAEAGFSGGNAAPWSSVNNCTEGGTRRRLKLELRSRGFDGSDDEIAILIRGSGLRFGQVALIYRNGRLQETRSEPMHELWPGWL